MTPPTTVERDELYRRLDLGAARRLTLVAADAGFGKSTALAAWARRREAAWYSVDRRDRDAARLAVGVATALRAHHPGLAAVDDVVGAGPQGARRSRALALAGTLCEAIADLDAARVVLVVDDVDELPARSAGAALLEGLVRQAPLALRLVLAGRAAPQFPMERLRGNGEVLELRAAALAFTPEETRQALAAVLDRPVGAEETAMIHRATGGWPVAVRLAAELAGEPDAPAPDRILRRPGGPVVRYFTSEVLARLPATHVAVLACAAALPRVTPPLCEHLGGLGAVTILPELAQRGLFLEPVSGLDDWYVVPQVVRQALEDTRSQTPAPTPGTPPS